MNYTAFRVIAALWLVIAVALIIAKLAHVIRAAWWVVLIPISVPVALMLLYGAFMLVFITATDFRS